MSVRIRYDDNGEGVLSSRRRFLTASGREVKVEITKENNGYRILDSVTSEVLASAEQVSRNLSVTKIKTKEALEALGVIFEDESRDRSNGEDPIHSDARQVYERANRGE